MALLRSVQAALIALLLVLGQLPLAVAGTGQPGLEPAEFGTQAAIVAHFEPFEDARNVQPSDPPSLHVPSVRHRVEVARGGTVVPSPACLSSGSNAHPSYWACAPPILI